MTDIVKDNGSSKKSRDDKGRKKDEKSLELLMKTLNNLQSPDEKLDTLCKKYAEIVEENRKLQTNSKQLDKKSIISQKEKEQLQLEYNKAVLTRSKLESLCRELQRQNKAIKDESLLKIREEEERRKETQAKFQATLAEITTLMQQNNDKSNKLRDDNIDMTKKFQSIVEQYEVREQQVEKMAKQMDLQNRLGEAKLAKAHTEALAEKELFMQEKRQMLIELKSYQTKLKEQEALESALRAQISMYTDKYDEFQNSLQRSNQVFGGFKNEMEKMSKKIVKLEKETLSWKQRWENSQSALLNMASDRQKQTNDLSHAQRQLQQLQKLCRTLQSDRASLVATLKSKGIERPPMPEPEPEAIVSDDMKFDKMQLNCLELKQNLAELQGQLSSITSAKATESKADSEKNTVTEKKTAMEKKNKKKKNSNVDNTNKAKCSDNLNTENEISQSQNQLADECTSTVDPNLIIKEQIVSEIENVCEKNDSDNLSSELDLADAITSNEADEAKIEELKNSPK